MINPSHFRLYVVRPVLEDIDDVIPYSEAAEELLMGTAATESNLTYLSQIHGGPAAGVYQMEPATADSLIYDYIQYRDDLHFLWMEYAGGETIPAVDKLRGDLRYATLMARIKYWQSPAPLPKADDLYGLGRFYKSIYNTALGKGSPEKFVSDYRRVVQR